MAKDQPVQTVTQAQKAPTPRPERNPTDAEKEYIAMKHVGYEIGECIDDKPNGIVNVHLFRVNRKGARTGFNTWIAVSVSNIVAVSKKKA